MANARGKARGLARKGDATVALPDLARALSGLKLPPATKVSTKKPAKEPAAKTKKPRRKPA